MPEPEAPNPSATRKQVYDAEPYHLEKYIAPGAVAVTVLFLLPWYLMGGSALGGADIGTSVVAALVLGHFIESLKVYRWGSEVDANYKVFQGMVDVLLQEWSVTEDAKHSKRALAQSSLFTVIDEGPGSEFAWNLVRWQKMMVIATLLMTAAGAWTLFAFCAFLELQGVNPFNGEFRLVILKDSLSLWYSIAGYGVLTVGHLVAASKMRKYGLERQLRTNAYYFQLIRHYREQILPMLNNKTPSLPREEA